MWATATVHAAIRAQLYANHVAAIDAATAELRKVIDETEARIRRLGEPKERTNR